MTEMNEYNKVAIGILYMCIIIILSAMVIGAISYRTKKDKENAYKDHIINKDIMPYYEENDLLSVQAYVIMDCEGGDGHCYQVELSVGDLRRGGRSSILRIYQSRINRVI